MEVTRNMLSSGRAYIKNGRFYGIFNTGQWAWYDEGDLKDPWHFLGGVASLINLEREKQIIWYTLNLPSGRRLYLPKLSLRHSTKVLKFIYDE